MIYHFTYIVTLVKSKKYYVGRHSTKNINDGYKGSGKWIRSIKDKHKLKIQILEFFNTFNELKEAELKLIKIHIDNKNNMNFNNNSIGFGTENLNPNRKPEAKERLSQRFSGDKNPSKRDEVRQKISNSLKGRPALNKGKKLSLQACKNISEGRKGIKYSEEGKLLLSISRKKQIERNERIIPSFKGCHQSEQVKEILRQKMFNRKTIECPHCNKYFKPQTFKRWHGNNCKQKMDIFK